MRVIRDSEDQSEKAQDRDTEQGKYLSSACSGIFCKEKRHRNRSSTFKNVTRCSTLACVLPNCIPSSVPLHPMHSKTHFLCMVFSSIRSFRTKRADGQIAMASSRQKHCVFDSSLCFKDSARRTFVLALEFCSWLTIFHMFWKAMILCSTPRARDCPCTSQSS